MHLAAESYQEAKKYASNSLSTELISVEALMALAVKDWDKAISKRSAKRCALYSSLDLQNLTILNNLRESYQGRVKQRQKLALNSRWEEDEEEEKYWLALAKEDKVKAQQFREKALEIASQEISLEAAKVFLRELKGEMLQDLEKSNLRESLTENIQLSQTESLQSSRDNFQELTTEKLSALPRGEGLESLLPIQSLGKLGREGANLSQTGNKIERIVSILNALEITEETIVLMVEVAQLNPHYWQKSEEMAVKLNNPNILASVWQAKAEYYYQQGNLAQALSLLNQANLTFSEERLSHNPYLYWTRARIYAQQGLRQESISNYQLALDKVGRIRFEIASGTRLNKEEFLNQTSP